MTIANPKTPEAAQRLLAELLEEPGALEVPQDSAACASPGEDNVKKDEPKPKKKAAPTAAFSIPEGDLLDINDEPAEVVMGQTAQLTGIEAPPVSKYIPPVLDPETLKPATPALERSEGSTVEGSAPGILKSLPPIVVGEEDLLPIGDDESTDREAGADAAAKADPSADAAAKEPSSDPVIEIKSESPPASVDVKMTPHGGPAEQHTERERPPDFSAMLKPDFSGADMRRKHPDGSYVVESDLLWKFLNHLYVTLSTDHSDMSHAMELVTKHQWLRAKKVAVVELFARGEAFRSLKGQQADQKRNIQVKDIEAIVGELTSLAEKEPDADRKRWLNESLRPATSWVEHQIDIDQKLAEKRELTTAGKTPHGATPASQPVPEAPPASMPIPAPEPRQKGVATPTKVYVTPAPADMTPPPEAVHTPPVAKREVTPAKVAEKTRPPENPPPAALKKKRIYWSDYVKVSLIFIFIGIGVSGYMAINEGKIDHTDDHTATAVKHPVTTKRDAAKPLVTPVATDECRTVKLAGVYGKPLTDKERHGVSAWDCSKQGRFTLLSADTGKVCGCTFK